MEVVSAHLSQCNQLPYMEVKVVVIARIQQNPVLADLNSAAARPLNCPVILATLPLLHVVCPVVILATVN